MPDWVWKQGDSGPIIIDNLTQGGLPVQPEDVTLTFRMRSLTDASEITLTGNIEFLDANGNVQFTPSNEDTSNPVGNYLGAWVLTNEMGQQQTFPTEGFLWGRIEPNINSAPELIVSTLDIKELLNIPAVDRTRDARLIDLIQAITPMIEAEVGPLIPRIYEEWHSGGSNIIKLNNDPSSGFGTNPVLKVLAVSEYRGPIEYPLALVASPAFGTIYSVMLIPELAAITRRSAGGRSIPFFPGTDSVHVFYQVGQNPIPENVKQAAKECVRTMYRWPQQTGGGSLSPADRMEMGSPMQHEVSRIVRMWTRPTRRFPAIG
jgi:hypothetical protein